MTADPRAREAKITGKPPRIGPLKPGEYGKEAQETVTALRAGIGLPSSDNVPEFTATALRHPRLFGAHNTLAVTLFTGEIPVRDRELAILRNAWLAGAPYEWGEHVKIGRRLGNVTPEEVERIIVGSAAPGWTDHERAIVRAVEELLADAMISDETWATLAKTWTDKQLIEFPLLIGQYLGVAYLQNSIRARLLEGNPGLSAR